MAVTGEEYFANIEAIESNRRARRAFRELALAQPSAGARIFDFGCGPGGDALFYAEHGFDVAAYDVDTEMCASFLMRCRDEIARGRVRLQQCGFEEFLRLPSPFAGTVDLITANFAPLSMIDELPAVFAKFDELARPGAKIVASVLNPYSLHDLRYGWWWRHQPRYWQRGEYSVAGPGYHIHRRSAATLARAAAPHFALTTVHAGLPLTGLWALPGLRRLAMIGGGFMFVIFEKPGERAGA